jgi:Cys-tRNA(Pro)/Cys-tRNA(Cys) deacylase
VPVTGMLDLKAVAEALGGRRAKLAEQQAAERATGYVVGGISPLAQKKPLPLVLDESAVLYDRIHVSAGRRGLEIALAADDLLRLTGGRYAPVAKDEKG